METLFDTILLLLLAYIGGQLGILLKMPAGALLGAMLFVGMFKITGLVTLSEVMPLLKIATQIGLGLIIGMQFNRNIFKLPLSQIVAFILLGMGSVATSLFIVAIFTKFHILSFITALIAVAPGGLPEMLTLSDSLGIDTQTIVIIHMIRLLLILLLFKTLLNWSLRKRLGGLS